MAVQGWLVGKVSARLGDRMTMSIGLAFGAIGLLAIGIAPTPLFFAAALLPNALWALAMPTLQSLMTNRVSEREQGQLQGATNSIASIAGVASPLFFGWLYGISGQSLPGFSFCVAAFVLLGAAVLGHRSCRSPVAATAG
jgi:DHA1 family tetracycline resistance protein-like MFS transporter